MSSLPDLVVLRWDVGCDDQDKYGVIRNALCRHAGAAAPYTAPYKHGNDRSYELAVFERGEGTESPAGWYVETTSVSGDLVVGRVGPFETAQQAASVLLLMTAGG